VNSVVRKLPAAPVESGGTAYVPLRFVGEATGGGVVWNASSRSVQITRPVSKSQDKADIVSLMSTLTSYFNSENTAGITSLSQAGSDFALSISAIEFSFRTYDLKSEIKSVDILSLDANEATVATVETSTRIGGAYIPDTQDEYIYTLVRNGSWKVSNIQTQKSTLLLTRDQGMKPAEMPQSISTAIQELLKRHYQSLNDKNVAGTLSTLTSHGEALKDTQKKSWEDFFKSYNLSYAVSASNVFYYSENEAAAYVERQITDKNESATYNQTLILVLNKSAEGTWTISNSYTVSDTMEGETNNP
uniref:stalk domain-containing protein n=1 Tax=Paenibacillus zanthoxyli TaxID=369399 RepID=UPI000471B47F